MTPNPEPHTPNSSRAAQAGWLAALIAALLLAAVIPPILTGSRAMSTIDRFIATWPHLNIKDYESATTPLYHIILAGVGHYLSDNLAFLRFAGSLFTLGLVMTVAGWAGRRMGTLGGVALSLPLITDVFIYCRAEHISPDNAAWWFVAIVLLLALRPRLRGTDYAWIALALTTLVLFRQIHLWCAGLVWAAAWLGPADEPLRPGIAGLFDKPGARARRLGLALLASVPAILTLAYFYHLWGNLMPPLMQTSPEHPNAGYKLHSIPLLGGNITTPALILSLAGAYAPFFMGYHWPAVRSLVDRSTARFSWTVVLMGAGFGLLAATIPQTNYSEPMWRTDDIWRIVSKFPTVQNRSLFIAALAPVGGACLGVFFLSLTWRHRWMLLATWVGVMVSQMTQFNCWQRHVEPGVLIFLAIFTALAAAQPNLARPEVRPLRIAPLGMLALALVLAVVTYAKYTSVPPPTVPDHPPLMLTPGSDAIEAVPLKR